QFNIRTIKEKIMCKRNLEMPGLRQAWLFVILVFLVPAGISAYADKVPSCCNFNSFSGTLSVSPSQLAYHVGDTVTVLPGIDNREGCYFLFVWCWHGAH